MEEAEGPRTLAEVDGWMDWGGEEGEGGGESGEEGGAKGRDQGERFFVEEIQSRREGIAIYEPTED